MILFIFFEERTKLKIYSEITLPFKENIEDNEDKAKNQQFKSSVNEILHQTSR